MRKHGANTASTTKKLFAAAGLALGVGSLALFPGVGTAAADGHNVGDEDSKGATWGAQDVGEQRGEDWVPAVNEGDMVPAVHSIDASTDSPHNNTWPQNNLPVASYPAAPSWPGAGWGVDDRG